MWGTSLEMWVSWEGRMGRALDLNASTPLGLGRTECVHGPIRGLAGWPD